MAFKLPELPYAHNALEPTLTKETLEFHHGKHHNAYVVNLNKLTEGKPQASQTLEEVILKSDGGLFNNAAQIWNHTFYWYCLKPKAGSAPTGALLAAINKTWGSLDSFKEKFVTASTTVFGSGWGWLVKNGDGNLEIVQTSNAAVPFTQGKRPLLTCDVWEHAYYIDYRNLRQKYIESVWNLIDWDFVQSQFERTDSSHEIFKGKNLFNT